MGAPWPDPKRAHDGGRGQLYIWPPVSEHKGPLPSIAVYDLAEKPTTYDFVVWSVVVKNLGAKAICFKHDDYISDWKYEKDVAWRRFGNILVPACKFIGLPWFINSTELGFSASHHDGWVMKLYDRIGRHGGEWQLLKASLKLSQTAFRDLPKDYVTITIRESIRNKYRDSNRPEWEKVRKELESRGTRVVLLEDSETSGYLLDIEHRMALYANASMNLASSNGPMALCHYSSAPYLTFNMVPNCAEGRALEHHMARLGFVPGSQYPWRHERQELVWEADNYQTIMDAYDRVMH